MKEETLRCIGVYKEIFNELLGLAMPCENIYQSDGLITHIAKHHPDCVQYFSSIPLIVAEPDMIGADPTKPNSIELIKKLDEYLLVAVALNMEEGYLYVASMFDQTPDKIARRLNSGRYLMVKE